MKVTGSGRTVEDGGAVRAFVALAVPRSWQDGIARLQTRLERDARGIRWVRSESVHLTLAFLGAVSRDRVGEITTGLDAVAKECAPCRLIPDMLGVFPSPGRAVVLWLGVRDITGNLARLQRRVEVAMLSVGYAAERRPFHPHLTMGRWRAAPPRSRVEAIVSSEIGSEWRVEGAEWIAGEMQLMESRLAPGGAVYSVLATWPLSGDATC